MNEAELLQHALKVRTVIVEHGGMATKSAVESVLMSMEPGLDRASAHEIMNTIEFNNMGLIDIEDGEFGLDDYREHMQGIFIRWYEGNPLEVSGD